MVAPAFASLGCSNSKMAAMKNSVRAMLAFSFKGETHTLESVLDIDKLAQRYQDTPPLHRLIAEDNQIDHYSYQFEVLELEEIEFDQPTGTAMPFLADGQFDFEAYFKHHKKLIRDNQLQAIANSELGIADLADHPQLKTALEKAYQLGLTA